MLKLMGGASVLLAGGLVGCERKPHRKIVSYSQMPEYQKPGKARKFGLGDTEAVDFLIGLGATLRDEIGGDYILSW